MKHCSIEVRDQRDGLCIVSGLGPMACQEWSNAQEHRTILRLGSGALGGRGRARGMAGRACVWCTPSFYTHPPLFVWTYTHPSTDVRTYVAGSTATVAAFSAADRGVPSVRHYFQDAHQCVRCVCVCWVGLVTLGLADLTTTIAALDFLDMHTHKHRPGSPAQICVRVTAIDRRTGREVRVVSLSLLETCVGVGVCHSRLPH